MTGATMTQSPELPEPEPEPKTHIAEWQLPAHMDKAERERLAAAEPAVDPLFRFIKWTQERLQQADPTMPDERAFNMAKRIISDNLHDEKCEFGDPRFRWDRSGAHELAEAYEIDHWESRP